MSIKFRVLGFFLCGGGKCRFYFYGREDFSEKYLDEVAHPREFLCEPLFGN